MSIKNSKIFETEIAGRLLVFEVGAFAQKSQSSVLAKYGETIVLATVCTKDISSEIGFLPLTVDFEERLYAGGRISTSRFIKREGRPSEEAILTDRLIDRSIRPLFEKYYPKEIQVIVTVLSIDQENDPAVLGILATSAALSISGIPWAGPIGAIRVGHKDGGYLANPQEKEIEFSDLDLIVVGKEGKTVMLEGGAREVAEDVILGAVEFAHREIQPIVSLIGEMKKKVGNKEEKPKATTLSAKDLKDVMTFIKKDILVKDFDYSEEKWQETAKEKLFEKFGERIDRRELSRIFEEEVRQFFQESIQNGIRPDGRKFNELRSLNMSVGLLPRTHGSALFERGETQILSIVTLGSPALEQLIEGMTGEGTKRFMHHYNFPPFSTGEVRRVGPTGRREVGHGVLAERALVPVIPPEDKFPYTIRVVSEVLASAGSTSMGAVCDSSLALMDAGVPISEPVAGVAIGLVTKGEKKIILTDIAYAEDAFGDMDFKIAGTKNGLTALQMDLKIRGIEKEIVSQSLSQAKEARVKILEKMRQTLPTFRATLSPYAPRVAVLHIDPAKIGEVIGSGGRVIRKIMEETGTVIDVEDDGTVNISGKDPTLCQKAVDWISSIVKEVKVGEFYEGEVKRILPFGAMVEFLPGKEGLVHISKLAPYRVGTVEDVVRIGQRVKVHVAEIDPQGRVNLSMISEGGRDIRARTQRNQNFPSRRRS